MPPKSSKGKAPATKKKGKDEKTEENKTEKKKAPKFASKCTRPIATGTIMAQRRLPPTICCPGASGGLPVRCCLPRPGCWPY